jgi:dynein light chain roadblock-type
MQQTTPSEETQNLLARLSQRPGVQSTLILARDTGAIVRASGLITREEIGDDGTAPTNGAYVNGTEGEIKKKGTRKAEEVAQLVYKFVKSAASMIEELNGENDESKLLRVRTKKNELVVVPGRMRRSLEVKHKSDFGRLEIFASRNTRHAASLS